MWVISNCIINVYQTWLISNLITILPDLVPFLIGVNKFITLGAHAQRRLQYSVCLCVTHCVTVFDTTLQASVVDRTLKFRHQRSADDTLECFDSWILLTMLPSRDMAKFVSQKAYDRDRTRCRLYANKTYGDVMSEHATSASIPCLANDRSL